MRLILTLFSDNKKVTKTFSGDIFIYTIKILTINTLSTNLIKKLYLLTALFGCYEHFFSIFGETDS